MRDVSGKRYRRNQNKRFMFSNFFPTIVQFMTMWENKVEASQATDDNIAHAHSMLDT
jgi:hypothetical protein